LLTENRAATCGTRIRNFRTQSRTKAVVNPGRLPATVKPFGNMTANLVTVMKACTLMAKEMVEGNCAWGLIYDGEWKDGLRHGQGIEEMVLGKTKIRFEGAFLNDSRHGFGIYSSSDGHRYEGQYRSGKQHGYGKETLRVGTYEGEWKEGKYNGRGTFVWKDGHRYVGGFRDNREHGEGTMFYADGKRYEGRWRNGYPFGQGVLIAPDGRRVNGTFEGEKFVTTD